MAVIAVASATVAGCSDSSRFGDGPGYAPATANQQAYLGSPQYQGQNRYRADTTGSVQPGYAQPQPEPWYGRPWQSPQAAPPTYQQPVYSQPQSYPQQPSYQAPTYQSQAAPVYPAPLKPLAMAKPAPQPMPPAQPQQQIVLQTGPSAVNARPKVAVAQPMPQPLPVQAAPSRVAAPATTGSTASQPVMPIAQPKMPAPVVATIQPPQHPAPSTPAQAPHPEARQLASNWSSVGGTYVTLKQGESISSLSQRYGVPVVAIMTANNFADATRVQPGQQILIPTYVYRGDQQAAAPAAPAHVASQPAPVEQLPKAGEHIVRHGESLESIARTYGIPLQKLEAANHLGGDAVLKPGQKIALPVVPGRHVAEAVTPPATTSPATPVATASVAPVAPPKPIAQVVAAKPQEQKTVTAAAAPASEPIVAVAQEPKPSVDTPRVDPNKQPSFRWPVRGRVIESFGATANGARNDGINLAVPEGTSVKSAEDGEVIYSGNELKGYGNVVLIKHPDGWVTVYAHASDLLVNKGDKVTRGQIIARAGATGSVTQPQLHFELRKGQKPVDPKTYLTN